MDARTDIFDRASRRARILEGATEIFLAYGFQRTTMDDIARAVDISRPALYLEFRNKADIYRALAAEIIEDGIAGARSVADGDGSLAERLEASVMHCMARMLEIEQTPHGADILDLKSSLAADLVYAGRSALGDVIEDIIMADAERQGIDLARRGLCKTVLAQMLLDAIDGLRARSVPGSDPRPAIRNYIRIVVDALNAPS